MEDPGSYLPEVRPEGSERLQLKLELFYSLWSNLDLLLELFYVPELLFGSETVWQIQQFRYKKQLKSKKCSKLISTVPGLFFGTGSLIHWTQITMIFSYEVLSTNGRPRSLEEQCLLQLKVNLEDVQIKHLRNKIPETLHKKLLNIVPN